MIKIQLLSPLSGELTVKDGTAFPITKTISDVKEFSKRKAEATKTCVLVGNDENNKLLGFIFNVNSTHLSFDPNKKILVNVLRDDELVMSDAYLKLVNINKQNKSASGDQEIEYEVVLTSTMSELFFNIKNKYLTDLDLNEGNHVYNRASILASSGNTYSDIYKYHLMYKPQTNIYELSDFKPGVFFRSYFDRIINNAGFTYQFSGPVPPTFDKLFVPYNGGKPIANPDNQYQWKTIAKNTNTIVTQNNSDYVLVAPTEELDLNNLWNGTEYAMQTTSNLNVSVEISFKMYLRGNSDYYVVGQPGESIIHSSLVALDSALDGQGIAVSQATTMIERFAGTGPISGALTEIGSFNNIISYQTTTPLQIYDLLSVRLVNGYSSGPFVKYRTGPSPSSPLASVDSFFIIDKIKITVTPLLTELTTNSLVYLNDFIPAKVKQEEIISTFLNMYNVYPTIDPKQANNIIFETRDNFYDSGKELDWTKLFDLNQESTITPLSEVKSKKLVIKYADDDKDFFTTSYKKEIGESYGQVDYIFENEFLTQTETIEIAPASTAIIRNNENGMNDIMPAIAATDPQNKWRLLLDNDWVPCVSIGWKFIENGVITSHSQYPLLHHFDHPLTPTQDINFGVCDYYFYNLTNFTNNNLYNNYWRRTVEQFNSAKRLEGYFNIDSTLFRSLKMNEKIWLNEAWWNIVEIKDYDLNANRPTKVTLISVDADLKFAKFKTKKPFIPTIGNNLISGPFIGFNQNYVNNNNTFITSFGSSVNGTGNLVNGTGVLVNGNNNSVNSNNTIISGNYNNTTTSGTTILGNNITATTPNTTYTNNLVVTNTLNGLPLSAYTTLISGTTNTIPKFSGSTLIDSKITDNGTHVSILGQSSDNLSMELVEIYRPNLVNTYDTIFRVRDKNDIRNIVEVAQDGIYSRGNSTIASNTVYGQQALFGGPSITFNPPSNATNSSAFGASTLRQLTTGNQNTAFGNFGMWLLSGGSFNTTIGYVTFGGLTSGDDNIGIGSQSGRYISGTTPLTNANKNIFIGNSILAGSNNLNNAIVIGDRATSLGDNTVVIGTTATTKNFFRGSFLAGTGATIVGNYSQAFGVNTSAYGDASHAEGSGTTTNGNAAHAEGVFTTANSVASHAGGIGTVTTMRGEWARSGGILSSAFKPQYGIVDLVAVTSNATPTELFIGGVTNNRIDIQIGTTFRFDNVAIAVNVATGEAKEWFGTGLIKNVGGTVSLVGGINSSIYEDPSMAPVSLAVTANPANDSLKFEGTGIAGTNIRWYVKVDYIKLS